jgi:hypothetical protein
MGGVQGRIAAQQTDERAYSGPPPLRVQCAQLVRGRGEAHVYFFFFFFVFVCVPLSRAVRREVSHEQAGGRAGTSPATHGLTDDQDSSSPRVSVGFRSGEGPRLKMDRDNRGPARPRPRHRHTKREESTKVV